MCKDTHRLKIKGCKKIYQANGEKKSRGGNSSLDKMDFKPTKIKRQRRALCNGKRINTTIRANYSKYICTNTGALRYIKQVLNNLQRDLDSHKIIVRGFNTP